MTHPRVPGKSHGQRSLVGYSPCSCKQLETTELLDLHFSPALQADFLPSEPPGKTLCEIFNKWVANISFPWVPAAAAAKSLQLCPTLCDPIGGSPPGSPPWNSPGKNTGVGCHFLLQCMKVKSESEVPQSCPTLSNPMDCSPPGSSVHGIFQARVWSGLPLPSPHEFLVSFYSKCHYKLYILLLFQFKFDIASIANQQSIWSQMTKKWR